MSADSSGPEAEPSTTLSARLIRFLFYSHTARVLMDASVQLKSLLASIAIVLIMDKELISCDNGQYETPDGSVPIPPSVAREACQPELATSAARSTFLVFTALNQLTFMFALTIKHLPSVRLWFSERGRVLSCYFIVFASFLFGFCKVFIISYLPVHPTPTFPCGSLSQTHSNSSFVSSRCEDKPIIVRVSDLPRALNASASPDGEWIQLTIGSSRCEYVSSTRR